MLATDRLLLGGAVVAVLAVIGYTYFSETPPPTPASGSKDVFGKSYDECLLRNATKGGDFESRQQATFICERNFIRKSTPKEESLTNTSVNIIQETTSPDGTHHDPEIEFTISNNNKHVILKHLDITVNFSGKDSSPLTWSEDVNIGPGENHVVEGSFYGNKAPSGTILGHRESVRVLSQTGEPG